MSDTTHTGRPVVRARRIPPHTQAKLREYLLAVPNLGKLLGRLVLDPRVPSNYKATLVVVVAYIYSPIDLVPSFIGGLGQFDDLIVAALALNHLLNEIDPAIVREHWDGDDDVLETIQEVLKITSSWVPERVRNLFTRFFSQS